MKLKTVFAIFLLYLPTSYLLAQTFTITGQIVDTKGYTLMGATIYVKGTVRGTSADIDGRFALEVSVGEELEFSFIGYQTQELKRGSYHIMFFGLKKPLQEGDKFDLNLKFKNAKPQKITVTVKPMQAGAMPAHDHGAGEAKHAH